MTKGGRTEHQADRLRMIIRRRRSTDEGDFGTLEFGRVRLEEAARLSSVTAHWGIATDIPVVTQVVVYWRRCMRLAMRWYINPIVEQQNAYNQAVLNALRDLRSENDALMAEIAGLRGRVPDGDRPA